MQAGLPGSFKPVEHDEIAISSAAAVGPNHVVASYTQVLLYM